PVYTTQASLLNRAAIDWPAQAANLGNRIARPNGTPAGAGRNFIDEIAFRAMAEAGVQPAQLCTDEEFLRRATIDLTRRVPTADKVRSFRDNPDRAALVDELLNSPEFIDRMVMYYGDLFQITWTTNFRGRTDFNEYIRNSVTIDQPY